MAEEYHHHVSHKESESRPVIVDDQAGVVEGVETKDRGMFDFLAGKKDEEKPGHVQEVVIATEFEEKVTVCEKPAEDEGEKKPHGLLDKLHRSDSSSSSSSDEEEGEDEEKKKKKKKEKRKEKKEEEKMQEEDTTVPVEKCEVEAIAPPPEEKKGFLEKIKEKLPGQHRKAAEEVPPPPPPPPVVEECAPPTEVPPPPPQCQEGESKEKKGILEKIKEKLPGYHPHNKTEEEKEKEKC